MTESPQPQGRSSAHFWSECPDCVYLSGVGLLLLALGTVLSLLDNDNAAVVVLIFGSAALLIGALWFRIEGPLKIGPFEVGVRREAARAIRHADVSSLRAVLPLIQSEDVGVALVKVPDRFAGHRVIDNELLFLRKKLQIQVIAIRELDATHWQAGGRVSETPWPKGGQLIVAGPPDTLQYFKALVASDSPELWTTVGG